MVMTTYADAAVGSRLIEALLAGRLAACVQTVPIGSHYHWKGSVVHEQETLLLIKTTAALYPAVEERIKALHPYEIPEILKVPVTSGLASYLRWVDESVAPPGG
jgi:periplasmic divalent cation tolerance protein